MIRLYKICSVKPFWCIKTANCLGIAIFMLFTLFFHEAFAALLEPTRKQSRQCVRIVDTIEDAHYSRKKMDNDMSRHIFDQYIKQLDPGKNLFTRKDMQEFEKTAFSYDDNLKKGRLKPAFHVFNIYLDRAFERTQFIQSLIPDWETVFDFEKDDMFVIDQDLRNWQPDKHHLFTIWRNELKNQIIAMMLDEQDRSSMTQTLEKSYANRMKRLEQMESDDAFQILMNVVSSCFDPHTQYMPPRASKDFDIHMSRSLEGIGAVLQTEYEYTKVVRLIPKGPADKSAQLMPGDKIIGVGQGKNGEILDTVGQRIDHVVDLIRGPKNTYVRLKIIPAKKNSATRTIKIKREKVKLEDQSAKKKLVTLNKNGRPLKIGVIEIPTFYIDFAAYNKGDKNYVSTTRDVKRLLVELKKEKIDGLIIDLRDNGGGALQEASQLTGLFLKTGPTVQVKYQHKIARLYDDDPSITYKGPLIVMMNRMSASASEIFAGAIKDYHRGIVVGSRSFGKGTVQELLNINDGRLKLTRAKFYRVSGESTQHLGILPDISFPKIYNTEFTGESSLEGALPWDRTIRSLYRAYPDLDVITEQLSQNYQLRSKNDPGIYYLEQRIQMISKLNDEKEVSLNLRQRKIKKQKIEADELTLINQYRTSVGKPALDTLDTSQDKEDFKDILMTQTHKIMSDFILLADNYQYRW